MSTDELERKLMEKEVELIRLLDKEGHLRSEERELFVNGHKVFIPEKPSVHG